MHRIIDYVFRSWAKEISLIHILFAFESRPSVVTMLLSSASANNPQLCLFYSAVLVTWKVNAAGAADQLFLNSSDWKMNLSGTNNILSNEFHQVAADPPVLTNAVANNQSPLTRKENSRFLNIFSVIDIPNEPCQSTMKPLRELNGTCYHPNDCNALGGTGMGECANGFGVCCFCKYRR